MIQKNVLVIAGNEGFMTKGLLNRLKGIGMKTDFSLPVVEELGDICEDKTLIIVFIDNELLKEKEALDFLRNHCVENDKSIMVIGSKGEYEAFTDNFLEAYVAQFYRRPLDMDKLLSDVEEFMKVAARDAMKKGILIVDDDASYVTKVMKWLKDEYRIYIANSGMEAIKWLGKNTPDLILLDYELPVTPGAKVLGMIRSNTATADIPVIFLTEKGDRESVLQVLALKPAGYILKTVDRMELRRNLENFFTVQRAK